MGFKKRELIEVVFDAAWDLELPELRVGVGTEDVRAAWAGWVLGNIGLKTTGDEGGTVVGAPFMVGEV